MTSDILEDIKKEILSKLPDEIQVSKVEFEGPEVVVYTKNPEIITENGDLIRSLAKELRKRIIIRSDKSALLEPEETINKIHEIVPDGAEITDIYFDTVTCEVVITAKKPGLVIGKYGVLEDRFRDDLPTDEGIEIAIRAIKSSDVKFTKEVNSQMTGQELLQWEDIKK